MSKKTVALINYEGHQYDPEYGTIWSDTWVRFYLRRRKVHLGPTLLSMTDLERDQELFGDDPKKFGYVEPDLPATDWDFCLPFGDDDGTPTIAINAPLVTKGGIEGAVEWYLRGRFGVTSPVKFRWQNRRQRVFFTPV